MNAAEKYPAWSLQQPMQPHRASALAQRGITPSMSPKDDCWENAPTESFWPTLKTKLVHHEHYKTRDQVRQPLFEYIEVLDNREQLHSSIGDQSAGSVRGKPESVTSPRPPLVEKARPSKFPA